MQKIAAILFEPVGCLAEFPSEHFHEIAVRFFGRNPQRPPSKSGSRAYWHLLNLMHAPGVHGASAEIDALEAHAVDAANIYDDVLPALSELKAMGVQLIVASSLSQSAVARFLEKNLLQGLFADVWDRDRAGGMKAEPVAKAIAAARLQAAQTMFLADTAEGLSVARTVGANAILMMNDPDEARRLAMTESGERPAGGIVSLHELPDFIRVLDAEHVAAEQRGRA